MALALALSCLASAQVAILQIKVIEGEGAVHAPGSRSSRPLVVEVTDETGKPVSDAAVSFHLPEDGPGGAFVNGLRTEVATTDHQGRATLRGLQVNRISGRFQIRIIASKEQARCGMVSAQYVAEAKSGIASRPAARGGHIRGIWIVAGAVVAGGTVAALAASGTFAGARSPAALPTPPLLTIGAPSLSVGKP